AVVHAARLAIAFRQKFKVDVMIDLWCYRRHGHNEVDPAEFTQPVLYKKIAAHKTTRQIYAEKLLAEGIVTQADLDAMKKIVIDRLQGARKLAEEVRPRERVPGFGGVWKGLGRAGSDWSAKTAVPKQMLLKIAEAQARIPEGFTLHPKLSKLLTTRRDMV